VTDLGKYGVIAAIMGAILFIGLGINNAPSANQQVVIVPPPTLEMLGPTYSEKGVFQDDTIRIAFDATFVDNQAESRLQFWLHNVSDDAITILWDRCSIQLPNGNTVKVLSEEGLDDFIPLGNVISVAPGGDLFDAAIPITEIMADETGDWYLTDGVLDAGPFTFVLAVEKGAPSPYFGHGGPQTDGCDQVATAIDRMLRHREVAYYTFRFVIR